MKCRYRKICKEEFDYPQADDCSHDDGWECPIYAKIDDIMLETLPFVEDYDGPVEEEEP